MRKRFLSLTLALVLLTISIPMYTASAAENDYPYEVQMIKELSFLSDRIYRTSFFDDDTFVAETNWTTEQFIAWYYDLNGKEIFPSSSKQLSVSGDMSIASIGDVIDKTGKILFNFAKGETTTVMDSWPFWTNGYIIIAKRDHSGYAVMNNKGEIIVPYGKYEMIDYYDGDKALVKDSGEWQIIDAETGSLIKSLKDYNFTFGNEQHQGKNFFAPFFRNGILAALDEKEQRNVAINLDGEIIFESDYWISAVDGEYAIVNAPDVEDYTPMLVDSDDNIIIQPGVYNDMFFRGEGVIQVSSEGGWPLGLVNTKGDVIAPIGIYQNILSDFKNGFTVALIIDEERGEAEDDRYYVIIGTDGKIAADVYFPGYQNIFYVNTRNEFLQKIDGKWYLMKLVETGTSVNPQLPPADPLSTATEWAKVHITRALDLELIPQNLQSNYQKPATRAEFCALAVALIESITGEEITARKEFTDTTDINVQKIGGMGIVTGTNAAAGTFSPNATLKREDAAVILAKLMNKMGKPLEEKTSTFADIGTASGYAVTAIGQMELSRIMTGSNGAFSPKGDYSIEMCITTILKVYDLLK